MSAQLKAIETLMVFIAKGGFLLALAFAIIGVFLVYLGAIGTTEISLFGQNIKSQNVGISSIFLSVVMVVVIVRRILTTVDNTSANESKTLVEPIPEELLEKHGGNRIAAIKEMRESQDA
ncbi:MAG: hypothetical protein ACXWE9_05655 [Methylobacter sp.]